MAIPKWSEYPAEPSDLSAIETGKTKSPPTEPTHVPVTGPVPAAPGLATEDMLSLQSATALLQQARRRAREEALP